MYKKLLTLTLLILVTLITTFSTIVVKDTYSGMTGNGCEVTTKNLTGTCYQDLAAWGFPFTFVRDSGVNSALGSIGPEDEFLASTFALNFLIYFAVLGFLLFLGKRLFQLQHNSG